MNRAMYMPMPARIERIVDETPTIKTFTIRPSVPMVFQAGQFVQLTVPGVGEAPFTPSSSPWQTERMDITIMRVGRVSGRLHRMSPGDEVGIRGPLGRAYPLAQFRDREVLIAGGGCGVGPLRALILDLLHSPDRCKRLIIRYGARTPDDLVFREAALDGFGAQDTCDMMLTVDSGNPGWDGHVGVLPTILTEKHLQCDAENGAAVMCGPPAMMSHTVSKLLERGYHPARIFLSLEGNMSCGVGKCGHCRLGRYYICTDGPVFSYDQIRSNPVVWDA